MSHLSPEEAARFVIEDEPEYFARLSPEERSDVAAIFARVIRAQLAHECLVVRDLLREEMALGEDPDTVLENRCAEHGRVAQATAHVQQPDPLSKFYADALGGTCPACKRPL